MLEVPAPKIQKSMPRKTKETFTGNPGEAPTKYRDPTKDARQTPKYREPTKDARELSKYRVPTEDARELLKYRDPTEDAKRSIKIM